MHKCNFCQRDDFPSPQSFYAHCRWCDAYKQHKHNLKSALGTSLRQAVPKAQPAQVTSSSMPPLPLPHLNDPFSPLKDFWQGLGVSLPNASGTQETPQQRRRRLLEAAKSKAIDRSWGFTGTVTVEMRAAARLTIDRELRDEPLEEFSSQEVIELAEGVRDRVYSSFWGRQKKEAQRTHEAEERKRADQRDDDRKHTERKKRKAAFLNEVQRRVITFLKIHALSPRQRLQVMEEVLTQLDETLTGDEPLPEAYAAIDAVLQTRVAQWDADEAVREARQQEEWIEVATVILGIMALGFMYVKVPEILLWMLNSFWPEPAKHSGTAGKPTGEAPCPPSNEQTPIRPVRRMRRPPQSAAPEPPSTPSNPESANPFL